MCPQGLTSGQATSRPGALGKLGFCVAGVSQAGRVTPISVLVTSPCADSQAPTKLCDFTGATWRQVDVCRGLRCGQTGIFVERNHFQEHLLGEATGHVERGGFPPPRLWASPREADSTRTDPSETGGVRPVPFIDRLIVKWMDFYWF